MSEKEEEAAAEEAEEGAPAEEIETPLQQRVDPKVTLRVTRRPYFLDLTPPRTCPHNCSALQHPVAAETGVGGAGQLAADGHPDAVPTRVLNHHADNHCILK